MLLLPLRVASTDFGQLERWTELILDMEGGLRKYRIAFHPSSEGIPPPPRARATFFLFIFLIFVPPFPFSHKSLSLLWGLLGPWQLAYENGIRVRGLVNFA